MSTTSTCASANAPLPCVSSLACLGAYCLEHTLEHESAFISWVSSVPQESCYATLFSNSSSSSQFTLFKQGLELVGCALFSRAHLRTPYCGEFLVFPGLARWPQQGCGPRRWMEPTRFVQGSGKAVAEVDPSVAMWQWRCGVSLSLPGSSSRGG